MCGDLLNRPPRIEPANNRKPPLSARSQTIPGLKVRLCADRHSDIEAVPNCHSEEVCWRDANDLDGLLVEHELLTHCRAATKLPLPEAITDNRARLSAPGLIVGR